MPISAARIEHDIRAIARATDSPGQGAGRPTFSLTWAEAVRYVVAQAQASGCTVRVDAAGNVHLRPAEIGQGVLVWLSGSHLDSVPHGGDFDGVVGVVVPLEILRAAHEDSRVLPLELVIFAEEEGTTFGLGMLGSRTWAGTLSAARLAELTNAAGQSYLAAGAPFGVAAERFDADRLQPGDFGGLIEVHIEQGPGMWKRGQSVALVTAINGRRQYQITLAGQANHAGSTSMADRRDALAGAAEMILAAESLATALGPTAVATVGRIACEPNAVNVISGGATFTVDLRAPADELLTRGDTEFRRQFAAIAARRGLTLAIEESEALPATALSSAVCERLRSSANRLGSPLPETTSGALHDAAILAPLVPTAMLFVASKDGISHNPAESSRSEDIALAAQILYAAIASDNA